MEVKRNFAYDTETKLQGPTRTVKFPCISPKMFQTIQTNNSSAKIPGEIVSRNKKREIAKVIIENESFVVSEKGANSPIFYKTVGYIEGEAENTYIQVLKFRFLPLVVTLAAAVIIATLIMATGGQEIRPNVIAPQTPIPNDEISLEQSEREDSSVEETEADTPEQQKENEAETQTQTSDLENRVVFENVAPSFPSNGNNGGGILPVVYATEVVVEVSSSNVNMYFKNKSSSEYDVRLTILTMVENKVLFESDLIKAGSEILSAKVCNEVCNLEKGKFSGMCIVRCYDPKSGNLITTIEIMDISIVVK